MPIPLTFEQIKTLRVSLNAENISAVYAFLSSQGYQYASWAKGVANNDTIAGMAATDYLTGTALMGLSGPECASLSETELVEGFWASLRDTGGEGYSAQSYNFTILCFMQTMSWSSEPEIELMAENWLSNVPPIFSLTQWQRWFNVGVDSFTSMLADFRSTLSEGGARQRRCDRGY